MKSLEGEVARLEAVIDSALALIRRENIPADGKVDAVRDLIEPHESYQSRKTNEERRRQGALR